MIGYSLKCLNKSKFEDEMIECMSEELNRIGDLLETSIEEKTPTDTKELIGNTKREKSTSSTLLERIWNDTPYAIYVEGYDGNGNKVINTTKNFHKGPPRSSSTVFYTGEGAAFMTRSFDEIFAKY